MKASFDLGLALHLCGEATDVALRLAGDVGAMGIVIAPAVWENCPQEQLIQMSTMLQVRTCI